MHAEIYTFDGQTPVGDLQILDLNYRIAEIEGTEWPLVSYWLETAREVVGQQPDWALEVAEAAQRWVPEDTEDTFSNRVLLLVELSIALRQRGREREGKTKLNQALQRAWGWEVQYDRLWVLLQVALKLAETDSEQAERILSLLDQQLLVLDDTARKEDLESLLEKEEVWETFPDWAEAQFAQLQDPLGRVIVLLQLARQEKERNSQ